MVTTAAHRKMFKIWYIIVGGVRKVYNIVPANATKIWNRLQYDVYCSSVCRYTVLNIIIIFWTRKKINIVDSSSE